MILGNVGCAPVGWDWCHVALHCPADRSSVHSESSCFSDHTLCRLSSTSCICINDSFMFWNYAVSPRKKNLPVYLRHCNSRKVLQGKSWMVLFQLCQPVLFVGLSELPHKLGHFPDLWPLVHLRFAFQIWCNLNLWHWEKSLVFIFLC